MEHRLDAMEIRILGSLIEKELSTPEYYPLSLNALTNACNQKSNRDPMVAYEERSVQTALERLMDKKLVWKSSVSRVPKYEERFTHERSLVPRESALVCVLLLRGPQTIGEIRGRTARLYDYVDLEELHAALANLEEWGLVRQLPRMPGHKESRYCHLLAADVEDPEMPAAPGVSENPSMDMDRIERIEQAIEHLQKEIADLQTAFDTFKNQFE